MNPDDFFTEPVRERMLQHAPAEKVNLLEHRFKRIVERNPVHFGNAGKIREFLEFCEWCAEAGVELVEPREEWLEAGFERL